MYYPVKDRFAFCSDGKLFDIGPIQPNLDGPTYEGGEVFGNVDRTYDVLVQNDTSTYLVNQRTYYPGNFFLARVPGPMKVSLVPKGEWRTEIENFSPSFDQRTPTIMPLNLEADPYVRTRKIDQETLLVKAEGINPLAGMQVKLRDG